LEIDRNVADPSGATIKCSRPDVVAWINGTLVFKAEEKNLRSEHNVAVNELSDKMEQWNYALYGQVPYILSYAGAQNFFQFFAITPNRGKSEISLTYDLNTYIGEYMVR